jgi:hypothetical protein
MGNWGKSNCKSFGHQLKNHIDQCNRAELLDVVSSRDFGNQRKDTKLSLAMSTFPRQNRSVSAAYPSSAVARTSCKIKLAAHPAQVQYLT